MSFSLPAFCQETPSFQTLETLSDKFHIQETMLSNGVSLELFAQEVGCEII